MANRRPRDIHDKLKAALAYSITGNASKASKICNIPERTIRDWTAMEWWVDLMGEARARNQDELDAQWTGLIHKCVSEIGDRLTNGDAFVKKDGTLGKKPISAREAALVAAISYDKRALMRGEVTRRTESVSTERKLEKIKESFSKIGKTAKEVIEVVEETENPEKAIH